MRNSGARIEPRESGHSAFAYVREDPEISLEIQEEAIWEYCRREGRAVDRFFRDSAEAFASADYLHELVGTLDRPGLAELVAMPLKDDVTIIVFRLDRFSPNPVLQEGLLLLLTGSGARVASCSSEDSDLLRQQSAGWGRVEGLPSDPTRRMIRVAVSTGADILPMILIRDQEYAGGAQDDNIPSTELKGSPSEHARLIRSRNPRASLRRIGRELEEAGYRRRDGAPWHPEQVRRMLQPA